MAITLTLWHYVIIACKDCSEDLARVVAREDYQDSFNATVGQVAIRHMGDHPGHLPDCRVARRVTWDELQTITADVAPSEAPGAGGDG